MVHVVVLLTADVTASKASGSGTVAPQKGSENVVSSAPAVKVTGCSEVS